MDKPSKTLMFCLVVVLVAMTVVHSNSEEEGPKEVEEWFEFLSLAKPKLTKLHFYFHDLVTGRNATAATVAEANGTHSSPTFFGITNIMDDPITVGPELSSKIVGRAQGLYASDSIAEVGLLCVINFVFTDGVYNGSSLTLLGQNPVGHPIREVPIVGGSGVCRLARGVAVFKTYFFNFSDFNSTVEVNVVAVHY